MEITARLVSDAQVAETKSGKKVVNFRVAINDYYLPKGGEAVELTTFVNCAYWISPGIAPRLVKGTLVQLYGRIAVNAYVAKTGSPVGVITFHVNNIKVHARPAAQAAQPRPASGTTPATDGQDDLPF